MEPINLEVFFDVSSDQVWDAITNPEKMKQWFFESMSEFEAEVGFETEFDVHWEGEVYRHQWAVTDVAPGKRIAYRWRYGGIQGDSIVIWEISPEGNGTKLSFTHEYIEAFPADSLVFSRESGLAGWNYFLKESLTRFLSP